jgi:hypothetical protein
MAVIRSQPGSWDKPHACAAGAHKAAASLSQAASQNCTLHSMLAADMSIFAFSLLDLGVTAGAHIAPCCKVSLSLAHALGLHWH